jgi:hypothetical protein
MPIQQGLKKTKTFKALAVLVAIFSISQLPLQLEAQSSPRENSYTLDEVLELYENGRFRIIQTYGSSLQVSANGQYVYSSHDGIYRVSDGMLFRQFDNAIFSPNSEYVFQVGQGVYRLADGSPVLNTSSFVYFSPDGEYAGVSEEGVYHLDTGQKVIDTNSPHIYFDPSSSFTATLDGVFRLNDGQPVLATSRYYARFSPDSAYAVLRDGVYRLADGEKLFNHFVEVFFTPDMHYLLNPGDCVYNLNNMERLFDLPQINPPYTLPTYSPDGRYFALEGNGLFRIDGGQKLSDISDVVFSPDSIYVAVSQDGVYRLNDWEKMFDLEGSVGGLLSDFSNNSAYLVLGHNSS